VIDRELFQGYAVNGIDAKGRVAIPAPLRASIEQNGDGRFVTIARHESAPCLVGYDRGWSRFLREQLRTDESAERASGRSFDRHNANRRAFGLVEEVPYDSSGRFILPGFMRDKAQLSDTAFFFGTGDTFEIWSPKLLLATPGVDEEMKEVVAWLLSQRGSQ
jgi:MraZ protein